MAKKKASAPSIGTNSNGRYAKGHEEEKKDDVNISPPPTSANGSHQCAAAAGNGSSNGTEATKSNGDVKGGQVEEPLVAQVELNGKDDIPRSANGLSREKNTTKESSSTKKSSKIVSMIRLLFLDLPLALLFAAYVGMVLVHQFHDDYWTPQLDLMRFIPDNRQFVDATYYHRICDANDVTATSVDELVIPLNSTKDQSVNHMLTHGVSMYQNVLSRSTAQELRKYILEENTKQENFAVIENQHRYSWGIDINMHPAIKRAFKDIGSNKQLITALQAIVGTDPAIIEFTAITSMYGAKTQYDHQDVVPPGSAAKFSRTFVPSYSLFMTLQDTTAQMGATNVCPGTHLCSQGCEDFCRDHSIAVSGDGIWPQGWGALVNQQTTHKGMAHYDPYGDARVVLVATFAPRPQTRRIGHETRMIAQGGSYSLRWNMWGHTLSDFIHAETRMKEPIKTLRSIGIVPGNGWTHPSVVSMRIANSDTDYGDGDLDYLLREKGGLDFLPKSWQPLQSKNWREFIFGTVTSTERAMREIYFIALAVYVVVLMMVEAIVRVIKGPSSGALGFRSFVRLIVIHCVVVAAAIYTMNVVSDSNWAKSIRSGKAFRLRTVRYLPEENEPQTLPYREDILISPYYDSDHLASYGQVLDVAHPGNAAWREEIRWLAGGYQHLPADVQEQVRSSLDSATRNVGRLLKPNNRRQWVEIANNAERNQLYHRELTMASDPLRKAMLKQIDSLKADAMVSPWFDMAIHDRITPEHLQFWEEILLSSPSKSRSSESIKKSSLRGPKGLASKPAKTTLTIRTRSSILDQPVKPPGIWIVEGNLFEGMYQCKYNEWYRGRISRVYANEFMADIMYEDGDEDLGMRGYCIRPFVPYKIGEGADLRIGEDNWVSGMVVTVHDHDTYDFLTNDDTLHRNVSVSRMRRSYPDFVVGSRVMGNFEGAGEFYPARIVGVNQDDNTFDLSYDDGDYETGVLPQNIQLPQ